ncbi:ABC transporter ATP-binding protein [Neobittarella massiliensis]|uniref:ABC transporter ATP-binding protein n=1 Tax=Neobittarella massiliensis (ex Bilen et al. 2018) TaxID=2041842 RepID=A0A8J6LYR5_9FIRM|nr:ABC transporter ATP-binding protein [Neobittarella massiliensis]
MRYTYLYIELCAAHRPYRGHRRPHRQEESIALNSFVQFRDVMKRYKMGEVTIAAANGITFEIEKGEFCVIVGPSGAGKTTVLNMLGGMDTCDGGEIIVDGKVVSAFNRRQMIDYRRYDIGFVFQFYNLVQNLTATENVELAAQICRDPQDAAEVLRQVGLGERLSNFPAQLSGGEQQRVAIARALAKRPKLLLCDEPTGALDYQTGKEVLALLQNTCRETGTTVVVITHNTALTPMADRVIKIKNSQVRSMVENPSPTPVEEIEW